MPRTEDQHLVDAARNVTTPVPAFAPDPVHLHDFDNCAIPGCKSADARVCPDLYKLVLDKIEQSLIDETSIAHQEEVDVAVIFSDGNQAS